MGPGGSRPSPEAEARGRLRGLLRSVMPVAVLSSSLAAQGFHFTVSTTVNAALQDADRDCALHLLFDLDPHVYADQYELAQRPDYTSSLWGDTDLERPVSAVHSNGSVLLITAHEHIIPRGQTTSPTFDVPLHVRYGKPSETSETAFRRVTIKRPVGFFACVNDSELLPSTNAATAALFIICPRSGSST